MASPSVSVSVLDRPLYSVTEAARLLTVPTTTLKRWLQGHAIRGTEYAPVIRAERNDSDEVTWGEFVEAGYLREYRRNQVPLQQLRPFIDALRDEFGVPYPLAHFKPFVDESRHLVLDLQRALDLDRRLLVVVEPDHPGEGQLMLAEPVLNYLNKVQFDPETEIVTAVKPRGSRSFVEIRPDLSFGLPTVNGIRTETIREAFATGDNVDDIARAWDLDKRLVEEALRWELRLDDHALTA